MGGPNIVENLMAGAIGKNGIAVLPEGHDLRVQEAARQLVAGGLAKQVLLGAPEPIEGVH